MIASPTTAAQTAIPIVAPSEIPPLLGVEVDFWVCAEFEDEGVKVVEASALLCERDSVFDDVDEDDVVRKGSSEIFVG